jgi:hypothetical protein
LNRAPGPLSTLAGAASEQTAWKHDRGFSQPCNDPCAGPGLPPAYSHPYMHHTHGAGEIALSPSQNLHHAKIGGDFGIGLRERKQIGGATDAVLSPATARWVVRRRREANGRIRSTARPFTPYIGASSTAADRAFSPTVKASSGKPQGWLEARGHELSPRLERHRNMRDATGVRPWAERGRIDGEFGQLADREGRGGRGRSAPRRSVREPPDELLIGPYRRPRRVTRALGSPCGCGLSQPFAILNVSAHARSSLTVSARWSAI